MNYSDFLLAGGKPKLVTRYLSGVGTYVPTVDNARCLVFIQGGGGGGGGGNMNGNPSVGGFGGGGGAMVRVFLRVPIAGYTYAVGAGGTGGTVTSYGIAGTSGGPSRFFTSVAPGGTNGSYNSSSLYWAASGGTLGYKSNAEYTYQLTAISMVDCIAGGFGGGAYNSSLGGAVGNPFGCYYSSAWVIQNTGGPTGQGTFSGAGGYTAGFPGGDSYFGIGGNGAPGTGVTVGGSPSGYGAGGGGGSATTSISAAAAGAAGGSGMIEIWDFGA